MKFHNGNELFQKSLQEGGEVIIGIDKAKGKDFTAQFNRFGLGGELIVNDEMDDVSYWAKDKAKELTKRELKRR